MSLGSYILYLRALKEGITPREVSAEIELPEHYIHAIELEKHGGDQTSRTKLAEYFDITVEEMGDCARSTLTRFMELVKKERKPQIGFLLMNGEILTGTVDGADNSIVKIVENSTGLKTILQRHAIKKWWPLRRPGGDDRRGAPRAGGGMRPGFGSRPGGARPGGFGNRPQGGPGGFGNRPGGGAPRPGYGAPRPNFGAPRPNYGAPDRGGYAPRDGSGFPPRYGGGYDNNGGGGYGGGRPDYNRPPVDDDF